MDLSIVFQQGDAVLVSVFLALMAMSVVTWYLILFKSLLVFQRHRANQRFLKQFWEVDSPSAARDIAGSNLESPLACLADAGFMAVDKFQQAPQLGDFNDFLIRSLRNAINREQARTAAGMTFLASIGSTAPFIGLFGTVWGIYHALITISETGSASMDMVAGPLGEALIATAAGLAAAIPAVLAYNAFQRTNRVLHEDLDGFAHDLHAFLLSITPLDALVKDSGKEQG